MKKRIKNLLIINSLIITVLFSLAFSSYAALEAPSNLTATAVSQTQINLSWQDNSLDETDFQIERSLNGSTGWAYISSVQRTRSFSDTGLSCWTRYYYRVRAHRDYDGEFSSYSNVANAKTHACDMPLPFFDSFDTDQGWVGYEDGGWERKPAVGGGGENGNPDPGDQPHPINHVLGFAIGGDYPNNLAEKSIVSPPIDCRGQQRVFLKFWRYLNVQSNYYDHAKIHVSTNGTNWSQLWENPVFDLTEDQWTQVVYDISSVAADQPNVHIKFTMGPTDSAYRFSGWNIDDFEVTSDFTEPLALYVLYGDMSNPNIDELLIQNSFGIKHSVETPGDLTDYALIIVDQAGNSQAANDIKNFVQNGGNAIIMGGAPRLLAGDTDDLSSIQDWFGAGAYGSDCGYGTVSAPKPFGTDLNINDRVDYAITNQCLAGSVYGENPETTVLSRWTTWGRTHSFLHHFGQGRVFYYAGDPGYPGIPDPAIVENGLILFEAGLVWTATGCTVPVITTQPQSQTISSGQTAVLSVAATAMAPLSYQWYEGTSGDTANPIAGATSSTYQTPALAQTTTYWVKVSTSCGYRDSDTAVVTICNTPVISSHPQSQTIWSGQAATLWVAASGTMPLSYQWYQGSTGNTSNPVGGATSSVFTTPPLTQTTSYWVRVSNSCGFADSSAASVTVIPMTAPSPPATVSASKGSFVDRVQVTWTASPGTDSYTVYRALSNHHYAKKTVLGSASGSHFDDTTAAPMKTYYYWVKASNAFGASDFSSYDAGYRSDGTPSLPTGVSASDGAHVDKVQVTWTAVPGADSYTVYRTAFPWGVKVVLATTSNTTYDDTAASPHRKYYYWVKASNSYGTSNFSSYDSGYRSDGIPPIPTGISASDGAYADKVQVNWTASAGADSYTVYRAALPWGVKVVLATTSNTTYDDTAASPGKKYYYWVKASNSNGTSYFSPYDAGYR